MSVEYVITDTTKHIRNNQALHFLGSKIKHRLKMPRCFPTITYMQRGYRKIPIISPGLIFVQKAFLLGLFSEEPIIGRNFSFQNGFGLSIKTAKNTKITA